MLLKKLTTFFKLTPDNLCMDLHVKKQYVPVFSRNARIHSPPIKIDQRLNWGEQASNGSPKHFAEKKITKKPKQIFKNILNIIVFLFRSVSFLNFQNCLFLVFSYSVHTKALSNIA